MKINGVFIDLPASLEKVEDRELRAFLKEWYNELSYVVGHTSGSTGVPKEIHLHKSDMKASAAMTNAFFNIGPASDLLLCLSVGYIAGKMMVIRALEAGANLVVRRVSASPLAEEEVKADLAAMVPMQVSETLKNPLSTQRLKQISCLLIGGAPLSCELEERLKSFPVRCYQTYGMTETVSHVALRALNEGKEYFALGKIRFSVDERQCLVVEAPHLQARKFVTNDVVKLRDDQHFEWLGRYDNVVNSGGIKLFPESIEARLSNWITGRFFITFLPDERLGQRLVLVIEGEKWEQAEIGKLQRKMKELLEHYAVPKEIRFISHFQETSSGKVIRRLVDPEFSYDGEKKQRP